ncbi:AraC family transcriptional regulator [Aquibacillus salsiterrae]|uniref:AraC family transcriptional regulator n=1 Tax=Aquibacillus salsiterrae TaxID=2950439 RepID=A0A9X3WEG2_9BACI|nr:AraC family transcriptional regulator [Aquibacillus salsiterrae]MDC3415919.1 AraC family transcriptional regulator [Aquibacillus salsiterrae]
MSEKDFPFWINHKIHTDRNLPPIHGHDFVEVVYVTDGEAEHIFEGELYHVSAGDVFIINPGEVHTYKLKEDSQLSIINCLFMPTLFDEVWLRGLGISESMDYFYVHPFLDKSERFHRCLNLRGQEAEETYRLLQNMINEFESKRNGYATLIRLQLVQLLVQLSRMYQKVNGDSRQTNVKSEERKTFIQRICGYLERHYDQKLTLTILSELFNISSRHLNRIFKEETGKTVIEFVHQVRINRAKKLLTESDAKIICIAMDVGYDDPAFFTRLFSRMVGCSPGKYREKINGNVVVNGITLDETSVTESHIQTIC